MCVILMFPWRFWQISDPFPAIMGVSVIWYYCFLCCGLWCPTIEVRKVLHGCCVWFWCFCCIFGRFWPSFGFLGYFGDFVGIASSDSVPVAQIDQDCWQLHSVPVSMVLSCAFDCVWWFLLSVIFVLFLLSFQPSWVLSTVYVLCMRIVIVYYCTIICIIVVLVID